MNSELPPRKRKRKRKPASDQPVRKRRRPEKRESVEETSGDSLGKLLEQHEVTLAGLLVMCSVLLFVGGGILGWGYFQNPMTKVSIAAMVVGGFVMLMGLILFGINVLNLGRRLELRKQGVRFTERGTTTELLWSDIVEVDVDRLDATNLGVGTKYTKSKDAAAVSGPLTNTEFSVTLRANDGSAIHLSSIFLRTVNDPKQMISNLKLRSGL